MTLSPVMNDVAAQTSDSVLKPASGPRRRYIDAHVHVWTPDVTMYPLAAGYEASAMQPPSFTPHRLLELARPAGVERVVLIQMSFYGFDNSYMLDTIKQFEGVFSGVAVVDENAPDLRDTVRQLAGRGVRGFRIRPGKRPVEEWIGSRGMAALWKAAAENGQAICPLINPETLANIEWMCGRFPDNTVVIDHFARIGADGQIRETDLVRLCRLAKFENTCVKTSAFYALGKKRAPYLDLVPMIRRLYDAFGPERLMWATDCPFQNVPGHGYQASIELIRDRLDFLSTSDRQWMLRKTAERVFFA